MENYNLTEHKNMREYLMLARAPRKFFKSVAKEKISLTLKKVAPIALVLFVIQVVLSTIALKEIHIFFQDPLHSLTFSLVFNSILCVASILVFSALLYLSLKILKLNPIFSQNVKVFIYPIIPISSASIIYYLLIMLAPSLFAKVALFFVLGITFFIWTICLNVIGISEIYKTSIGKAIGLYLLAYALLFGIFLVLGMLLASIYILSFLLLYWLPIIN